MTAITGNDMRHAPAYLIARVDITDPEQYRHYLNATPPIIEKYGGDAIARSAEPITLEGPDETRRIVILQFPSVEMAKEFYHSPEYQEARKLREGAAIGELVVVESIAAANWQGAGDRPDDNPER